MYLKVSFTYRRYETAGNANCEAQQRLTASEIYQKLHHTYTTHYFLFTFPLPTSFFTHIQAITINLVLYVHS